MANLKLNAELKKVVGRVKSAQGQLQALIKNQDWVDEARKYAERQSKEVRKILNGDVTKVKAFLEKERKELEKFQKQIPGEVKKVREFVIGQRKELEKLLANVKKVASQGAPGVMKTASKAAGKASRSAAKKVGAKKKASKASTIMNPGLEPSASVAPGAPESNPLPNNGGGSTL